MACGEVELVHAGNEFNQQQWRHAKPYIQIAEDWVSDAEASTRQCGAAPAVLPVDTVIVCAGQDPLRELQAEPGLPGAAARKARQQILAAHPDAVALSRDAMPPSPRTSTRRASKRRPARQRRRRRWAHRRD